MRVLVVGSGGREHALAWKLASNPTVDRIYAAPGNPGMAEVCMCAPITADDVSGLASFAEEKQVDLTVVGPEGPLAAGIADEFTRRSLRIFGPTAAAAEIESSKVFFREFAARHDVPIAGGACFEDPDAAVDYARSVSPPIVVKAEGLAAGKGVLICDDLGSARSAVDAIMREGRFGAAGSRVIVEEFMRGREISLLCLTDGEAILVLEPAQDYKRAFDADVGPNTGGMGAYSPVPWLEPVVRDRAVKSAVEPLIHGLAAEGRRYVGCFYCQLMIDGEDVRVVEINARFGDPETQVLVPRISSDLLEVMLACVEGNLRNYTMGWHRDATVGVVVAAGGYPDAYTTGLEVAGIDDAEAVPGVVVFHAGTQERGGRILTASGRILNVVARGPTIASARKRAYEAAGKLRIEGMRYRTDIAKGIA